MGNTGLSEAKQRVAASASGAKGGQCPNCVKQGVAVFPACALPMSEPVFASYQQGGTINSWLTQLAEKVEVADLPESKACMRALPPGYLYVLKPDTTWDAFVVGVDGLLVKTPVDLLPDSPNKTKVSVSCKRKGHSNVATQFICLDPSTTAGVHMAFSRRRWTRAVRQRLEANADGCRDTRMQWFDVQAAANGQLSTGRVSDHAAMADEDLLGAVADYVPEGIRNKINRMALTRLYNRHDQNKALAQRMAAVSALTPAGTGAIALLDDFMDVRLWLLDHDRQRVPVGTPYRFTAGTIVREGKTVGAPDGRDGSVLKEDCIPGYLERAFVEWGAPQNTEQATWSDPNFHRLKRGIETLLSHAPSSPFILGTTPVKAARGFPHAGNVDLQILDDAVLPDAAVEGRLRNRGLFLGHMRTSVAVFAHEHGLDPATEDDQLRTSLRDAHRDGDPRKVDTSGYGDWIMPDSNEALA